MDDDQHATRTRNLGLRRATRYHCANRPVWFMKLNGVVKGINTYFQVICAKRLLSRRPLISTRHPRWINCVVHDMWVVCGLACIAVRKKKKKKKKKKEGGGGGNERLTFTLFFYLLLSLLLLVLCRNSTSFRVRDAWFVHKRNYSIYYVVFFSGGLETKEVSVMSWSICKSYGQTSGWRHSSVAFFRGDGTWVIFCMSGERVAQPAFYGLQIYNILGL